MSVLLSSNCGRVAVAFLLLAASGCGRDDAPNPSTSGGEAAAFDENSPQRATATLEGPDGASLGEANFEQTRSGVLIRVTLQGLPAGAHAIHIHEKGACTPDFKAAGGHFAPAGRAHGYLAPQGPHAGDMPNFHVSGADEKMELEIMNERISLGEGETGGLFDADGSALVVHGNADDYVTQPSGDAGDRIACGVIERAQAQ